MTIVDPLPAVQTVETHDGIVAKIFKKLFLRDGYVESIEALTKDFSLITLAGDGLRGVNWTPGDKVQVMTGDGFTNRTYTPISWDTPSGRMRFMAYLHGDAPGCRWIRNAHSNDVVRLLGPRNSINLPDVAASAVLFGDETSFSLAAALRGIDEANIARCVFEVDDIDQSAGALGAIGISDAILIARLPYDDHLARVSTELTGGADDAARFVMTGKAGSIQAVKKALAMAGIGNTRMTAKAYWAPGKSGLD